MSLINQQLFHIFTFYLFVETLVNFGGVIVFPGDVMCYLVKLKWKKSGKILL